MTSVKQYIQDKFLFRIVNMSTAKDIKILVAEDDPELLTNVVELFQIFGFQVTAATNGKDALEKLIKAPCDILLTDVRMPQMDGIDLLKRVKQIDPNNPKVVMLSGYTDQSVDELLDLGADAFFSKPFDASAVRSCLNQTLLNPRQRWGGKKTVTTSMEIHKKIKSLNEGIASKEFSLGRSGFFARMEFDKPKVNDWVHFHIEIADGNPGKTIDGLGQVIWVREKDDNQLTAGVGVEFHNLDSFTLETLEPWYASQKIIPSIPRL
jgi:CheY-like chemotaxis protein